MSVLVRLSIILGLYILSNPMFADNERALSLADLKWQNRLLNAHISNPTDVIETLKLWPREQLEERKLRVFLIHKKQVAELNPDATLTPVSLQHSEFDAIKLAQQTIVLIGLDGGVKARLPIAEFNPKIINTIIDSMPMRMAESQFN